MRVRFLEQRGVEPVQPVEIRRDDAWVGRAHLDTWQLVDDGDGARWRGHVYRYDVDEQGRPALRTEWYDGDDIKPVPAE